MITRRNWLLRCSILINVAVLLYICSHVMIGGNMALGPGFIITEDGGAKPSPQQLVLGRQHESGGPSTSTGGRTGQMAQEAGPVREPLMVYGTNGLEYQNGPMLTGEQQQQQQSLSQQQQQQQQLSENTILANDNNAIDDRRAEVPTESTIKAAVQQTSSNSNRPSDSIVYQDVSLVVTNTTDGDEFSSSSMANLENLESRLKTLIHCHNKDYDSTTSQRGDFWVLRNYIRADHGELRCLETITYTTHADYTFLDNLIPLLERWNAPVSIALHAPGTDFLPTINSIKYLRDCTPEAHLVRKLTTFHIFFSSKHIPKQVPQYNKVVQTPYNCSIPPPFSNITSSQLYKTQKKLLYPVNVGRNIARDAAMTHYILASDIELYPNPNLVRKFLEMIARNDKPLQRSNPRVYPLPIFEVDSASTVPRDKTELQELLKTTKAIPFHKRVCASCHGVPKSKEWMAANETEELGIFHIGKRVGYYVHWEPIYIGTHADPHYDERLSWEGKSDKMTQGYALCALDYEFHILDNAFLVHKPGIKILKKDPKRAMLAAKTNQLIRKIIYPELQVMYGVRKGCAV